MTDDDRIENTIERGELMRRLVAIAERAEAAWSKADIASLLLVVHLRYAQKILNSADIAAGLRQVADQLDASPEPPRLEPELLQ